MDIKIILLTALLLLSGCTRRVEEAPPSEDAPTATLSPSETPAVPTAVPEAPSSLPAVTPAPAPTPVPTPAPPVTAGIYRWSGGEDGVWQLNLKDNGTFSVIHGEHIYNGEGWCDNGNGSITTGPTDAAGAAPFFDEFGSSMWRIDGALCEPVM